MSSISRWYLDAQHSFSFKRYTKFRALHYNQFKAYFADFMSIKACISLTFTSIKF